MGDSILSSNEAGFKAQRFHPPRVLLVEENPFVRAFLAERISRQYSAPVDQAATATEAEAIARDRPFDIIIFGNPDWEEGVLLYLDLLNRHRSPCQFILFMDEQAGQIENFEGLLKVVRKPDFDGLLEAANWTAIAAGAPPGAI